MNQLSYLCRTETRMDRILNKTILRLAIPNIVSNITVPLLGIVDMALMGHLDKAVYIGAIGLGGTIFSVLYSFFSFMRAGTTGFTAQAYGSDDRNEISYSFYRSVCIALIATILVLTLIRPIEWISLKLLNGSDEALYYTALYFRVRIWAAPAVLLLYTFNGWYIGLQNTAVPMTIAIVINAVNIICSVLFVQVGHLGVEGVALGTVIAQYSGLALALVFLFTKYREYLIPIDRKTLLQSERLKRFFKVNTDFMIRSILLILTIAFFTNQSARLGDNTLAVNMVLMQFFYIFSYFTDGFAYAGEALVGRFVGSRDRVRLRRTVKYLLVWGVTLSVPFTILYLLFPDSLFGIISDQASLRETARPYYLYMVLIPIVTFAAFLWDGIYIGATASRAIRNTMIIASLIVFLPAWYVLMPIYGNHGLWTAFLLFMVARGVSMSLMARKAIFGKISG